MKASKEHLEAIEKARGSGKAVSDLIDPDDPWYKPSPPEYYTSYEPGDIVMLDKTIEESGTPLLPDGGIHPDSIHPADRAMMAEEETEEMTDSERVAHKAFDAAHRAFMSTGKKRR